MNFFNRTKTRTPQESARSLRDYLQRLDQPGSPESKRKASLACLVTIVISIDSRSRKSARA